MTFANLVSKFGGLFFAQEKLLCNRGANQQVRGKKDWSKFEMTRLTFVGDIACDRPLLKAAKHGGKYDFSRVFQTQEVFQGSDFVIGNLESCFGGGHYGKKPYHYSVPDSFGDAIRDAGFDLVSTANNHCLDEGVEGLERTIKVLDRLGISHTGTFAQVEDKRWLTKEINGRRRFKGTLKGIQGQNVLIDFEGSELSFEFSNIEKAKLTLPDEIFNRRKGV